MQTIRRYVRREDGDWRKESRVCGVACLLAYRATYAPEYTMLLPFPSSWIVIPDAFRCFVLFCLVACKTATRLTTSRLITTIHDSWVMKWIACFCRISTSSAQAAWHKCTTAQGAAIGYHKFVITWWLRSVFSMVTLSGSVHGDERWSNVLMTWTDLSITAARSNWPTSTLTK